MSDNIAIDFTNIKNREINFNISNSYINMDLLMDLLKEMSTYKPQEQYIYYKFLYIYNNKEEYTYNEWLKSFKCDKDIAYFKYVKKSKSKRLQKKYNKKYGIIITKKLKYELDNRGYLNKNDK